MRRRKMPRALDNKIFRRQADLTRGVNITKTVPRGGIRF